MAKSSEEKRAQLAAEINFYESFIASEKETVLIITGSGSEKDKGIYSDIFEDHAVIVSTLVDFRTNIFDIGTRAVITCGYNTLKYGERVEGALKTANVKYTKVSKSQNYKVIEKFEPKENKYNEILKRSKIVFAKTKRADIICERIRKLVRFDSTEDVFGKIENLLDELGRT